MGRYVRPATVAKAVEALSDGGLTIVAGGTDHYPARVGKALDEDVLDISGIGGLRAIEDEDAHWRIGALATWTDLLRTPLPPYFDALKAAAREVGGVQIQNRGTIMGNLCNASPAADAVPCLLSLDAELELDAAGGRRVVDLQSFITGNRTTARRDDELAVAILVPKPERPAVSAFSKLGSRAYLVISIVMVAAVVERASDDTVARARLAVGACSEVATRLPELEAALAGRSLDGRLGEVVAPEHLSRLAPIDDVRGAASYRLDAAETLIKRMLGALGEHA